MDLATEQEEMRQKFRERQVEEETNRICLINKLLGSYQGEPLRFLIAPEFRTQLNDKWNKYWSYSDLKEFETWALEKDILVLTEQKLNQFLNERRQRRIASTITRVIPKETRHQILRSQKWRCNECNQILTFSNKSKWDGEVAHIDHIHPFADRINYPGGAGNINERSNLQALCPACNQKKQKKQS